MKKLSKTLALLLALTMVLCLAACGGSKDALSGTWSADLGDDGVITWTFDGKGKCTMENSYMKQKGTYTTVSYTHLPRRSRSSYPLRV